MIHFEKAKSGVQISDFSNFMRKIMEKYNWEETLGMSMIEEYNRINPISRQDFVQLYNRLAYPEKFWKITNRITTQERHGFLQKCRKNFHFLSHRQKKKAVFAESVCVSDIAFGFLRF